MANIKQIKINGTVYTVKDETARAKAVNADALQTDSAAPSYIQNLPLGAVETILGEGVLTFSETYMGSTCDTALSAALTAGETYRVAWDGTEYLCKCQSNLSDDGITLTGCYLGNASLLLADTFADTGEPFFISCTAGSTAVSIVSSDTAATHTVGIHRIRVLQRGWLSDAVADKDDIQSATNRIIDPDTYPISQVADTVTPIAIELGGLSVSNGEETVRTDAVRAAEYLPVTPGTTVYFTNSLTSADSLRVICYDADKNYVQTIYKDIRAEIDVLDTWAYLRFYRSDTADTTMEATLVVKGETEVTEFQKMYFKDSGYTLSGSLIGHDETLHKVLLKSNGKDDNTHTIFEIAAPSDNALESTLCLMNYDGDHYQFVDFSSMVYGEEYTVEIVCQTREGKPLPEFSVRYNDGEGAGRVKKFAVHPDCIPMELTAEGIKVRRNNDFNNTGTDDEYVTVDLAALMDRIATLESKIAELTSAAEASL
ncbi:MAG: hypothetical protein IJX64_04260 [Clostridia bacterium]|nr:hypothetical protein [Clostridia bacterium]